MLEYKVTITIWFSYHRVACNMYRLFKLKQNEIYSWKGNIYMRDTATKGKKEEKNFWWDSLSFWFAIFTSLRGLDAAP